MDTPPQKRSFRRIPIAYRVKLIAEDQIIAYPFAINLSMGGILVDGRESLPVGSECGVAILLAEGGGTRPVVARGTVIRSDTKGLAIAFSKALDANSEDALRTLIQSLDPGAEMPELPPGLTSFQRPARME